MSNPKGINQYTRGASASMKKAAVKVKKHAARLDSAYAKIDKQGSTSRTRKQLGAAKRAAQSSTFAPSRAFKAAKYGK